MNPRLPHSVHQRTAVLIFELGKPRTARELAFYTSMSEETVCLYLDALRAKRIAYIADYRFSAKTGRWVPCYALDLSGRKPDVTQPQGVMK